MTEAKINFGEMKTAVIINVHNKEKELHKFILENNFEWIKKTHICFVNNGSTDGTADLLDLLIEKFPKNVSVVNIKNCKNQEAILKAGFRYLLRKEKFQQVNFYNQFNDIDITLLPELNSSLIVNK